MGLLEPFDGSEGAVRREGNRERPRRRVCRPDSRCPGRLPVTKARPSGSEDVHVAMDGPPAGVRENTLREYSPWVDSRGASPMLHRALSLTRQILKSLLPAQQIRLAIGFALLAALVAGTIATRSLNAAGSMMLDDASDATILEMLRRAQFLVALATTVSVVLGLLIWYALRIKIVRPLRRMRALERSNGSLRGFVQSVSHDLQAPLASVSGFLTMAREELGDGDIESASGLLSRAEAASSRADHLVQDLLQLARLDQQGTPTTCDLRSAVSSALEDVTDTLLERRVALRLGQDLGAARVDPAALRQSLSNVIGNAVKYATLGEAPRLTFHSEHEANTVTLRICDNGPGIPAEDRMRALIPFQRLTEAVDGTGIGLALVQRAMENAGGSVALEETPRGGTTVALTFQSAAAGLEPSSSSTDEIAYAAGVGPTTLSGIADIVRESARAPEGTSNEPCRDKARMRIEV